MNNQGKELYEFGPFRLDPGKRILLRDNQPVPLQLKAFETLLVLVRQGGQVVLKDDLMKAVWPDSFVEESNLAQNVFVLRKTLGDTVGDHRYIITIPGRGYSFAGKVRIVSEEESLVLESHSRMRVVVQHTHPRWRSAVFTLVVLVLVSILLLAVASFSGRWNTRSVKFDSLAVLPFADLSSGSSDQYLSDGMTDELVTELTQLGALRVISTRSSAKYKGTNKSAAQIGHELGVDLLVQGTVQQVGDRVRVRTQLVEASTDSELWASSYDREAKDILFLQSDAARDIAQAVTGKQLPLLYPANPKKVRPVNPEAYAACVRGRYFLSTRSHDGISKAQAEFQHAVDKDPEYAAAYAGLANYYILSDAYLEVDSADVFPKARAAAEKALSLDESTAAAHAALGEYFFLYEFNTQEAGKHYQRALQLDPSDVNTRTWYARNYLETTGRLEEATAQLKRVLEVDPLSLITMTALAGAYYYQKNYDGAIAMCRKALEIDSNFLPAHVQLEFAYYVEKRWPEFLAERRILAKWDPPNAGYTSPDDLEKAYSTAGEKGLEQAWQHSIENSKADYQSPILLAELYAQQGDKDKAFYQLEKAYRARDYEVLVIKIDPWLESLHADPRFADLIRRIGLPQ